MATYKKDSMHNKYDPKWANLHLRVEQDVRMKFERYAKSHGLGLQEAGRFIIIDAVKDVKLTSEDYAEIARRMKVNEERNDNRG